MSTDCDVLLGARLPRADLLSDALPELSFLATAAFASPWPSPVPNWRVLQVATVRVMLETRPPNLLDCFLVTRAVDKPLWSCERPRGFDGSVANEPPWPCTR